MIDLIALQAELDKSNPGARIRIVGSNEVVAKSRQYNGWANHETWCVHLWLTNEEGMYHDCRAMAREIQENEAPEHENIATGIWSVEEAARFLMADWLKDYVDEMPCNRLDASMASDLLRSALSEVDWEEVANAFLEEVSE